MEQTLLILIIFALVAWTPVSYMTGMVRGFTACKSQHSSPEHYLVEKNKKENLANPFAPGYTSPIGEHSTKVVRNEDGSVRYVKPRMSCCSSAINHKNINLMPYMRPIGIANLHSDS